MDLVSLLLGEVEPHPVFFVGIGYFDTIVISENGAGLSSTLRPETGKHKKVKDAGSLTDKNARELAEYVFSRNPLEVSIGMASINASIKLPDEYTVVNAKDVIIQRGTGKTVGIIGHFPFVEDIRKKARELYIFEKEPRDNDLAESDIPKYLPTCDVVAITGMSIMNRSFEYIIKHTKHSAFKIVLGPSTPLSPILFDFGIDALSGVIVKNTESAKKSILEGAPFRYIQGIELVTIFKDNAG